jgi:transposase-like protein
MRRIAIGERPNSRGELARWYASILEQQAESGLSVREYAARAGLSAWTLYEWRRRLSSLDSDETPKLIEVAVAGRTSADAAGALVVRLGDGRRSIAVPAGFDSDELRRLMAVLESC